MRMKLESQSSWESKGETPLSPNAAGVLSCTCCIFVSNRQPLTSARISFILASAHSAQRLWIQERTLALIPNFAHKGATHMSSARTNGYFILWFQTINGTEVEYTLEPMTRLKAVKYAKELLLTVPTYTSYTIGEATSCS